MPTPITVMICVGLASETVFLSFIPRRAKLYEAEWRKNGNGNFRAALVASPIASTSGAQWIRTKQSEPMEKNGDGASRVLNRGEHYRLCPMIENRPLRPGLRLKVITIVWLIA